MLYIWTANFDPQEQKQLTLLEYILYPDIAAVPQVSGPREAFNPISGTEENLRASSPVVVVRVPIRESQVQSMLGMSADGSPTQHAELLASVDLSPRDAIFGMIITGVDPREKQKQQAFTSLRRRHRAGPVEYPSMPAPIPSQSHLAIIHHQLHFGLNGRVLRLSLTLRTANFSSLPPLFAMADTVLVLMHFRLPPSFVDTKPKS
ncbi:hypothetical protein PENANT_c069G10203 [Penicillium antarcticum]|uniref:Uncharacterized protein n=1 Tax=Penicillium antarcticum TaxID=416450 RepID=A0A1V6PPP0_9EURO|nr:hypothetical protein PENANT_c069G10203 [Penicillium antarcticum]